MDPSHPLSYIFQISLIASDSEARPITSWNQEEQNVQPVSIILLNGHFKFGPKPQVLV